MGGGGGRGRKRKFKEIKIDLPQTATSLQECCPSVTRIEECVLVRVPQVYISDLIIIIIIFQSEMRLNTNKNIESFVAAFNGCFCKLKHERGAGLK